MKKFPILIWNDYILKLDLEFSDFDSTKYDIGQVNKLVDSRGKISMNLYSLLGFLMNPFYKRDLWNWNTLDINYAFVMIYSLFVYYMC